VRLADFPLLGDGRAPGDALARVAELEAEFSRTIAPAMRADDAGPPAEKLFRFAEELGQQAERFAGLEHWREVESAYIRPRLEHLLAHISLHLVGKVRNDWAAWKESYAPAMEALLVAIGDRHRAGAQVQSDRIAERLDPLLPESLRRESLSRKTLAMLAGLPGTSCVLVGMRRGEYVEDVLGLMRRDLPPVSPERFARFQGRD
jgi:hypothetical protein